MPDNFIDYITDCGGCEEFLHGGTIALPAAHEAAGC